MNAEGADVINLGIGSPDLPPSQDVINALCNEAKLEGAHGYQSYVGIPQLREAFANWYKRFYNVQLDPTCEILPLMGSKEGIMHISMAFLNEGDGGLIPNPGYPTYSSVAKLVGAKIVNYNLTEENNWHPNLDALEEADAKGDISLKDIKLMWCNYPNMPTGANSSLEIFEKLVAFSKKHNIVICHDDPYSFVLTEKPLSILEVKGAKDICIELNSLSKSSNMPGWRIGMVGSNKNFIEWILRVKSNMDSGMFKPLQVAAVKALEAPDTWYKEMNAIYNRRKELATKIMRAVGFSCSIEIVIKDNNFNSYTVIPFTSLINNPNNNNGCVYVYDPATKRVNKRDVKYGEIFDKDKVVIVSGLNPGEYVVSAGATRVVDGEEVKLLND